MNKHRLNLDSLAVQSFETRKFLPEDEAYNTPGSGKQCVSELSACGVCPSDPCPLTGIA